MAKLKRIGFIGEAPYDRDSIRNLLLSKYEFDYVPLLNNQTGDNLETAKTHRILEIELKNKKPDFLIFIRDLDSFESDDKQISKRFEWFRKLKLGFDGISLFLLNIYELEALILSDIATFNKIFKSDISYTSNPMMQKEPKELLMRKTRKSKREFRESDNPGIFQELDFEEVKRRCRYFRNFIKDFDKALAS